MVLAQIRQDHANIARLLLVLEQKLKILRQDGRTINYQLMLDVIEYLQNYADRYHHPLEDAIYRYYLEHQGQASDSINRLEEEHIKLKHKTSELRDIVDMILLDAIVPQDEFINRLEEFINLQSSHLSYEEAHILPQLERELNESDWRQIEQETAVAERDDPLFGAEVAQRYRALAERIRQAEEEEV